MLICWLPLNGNTDNQGLGEGKVVNHGGTPVNGNQGYLFDGAGANLDTGWGNGMSANNLTITMWVKSMDDGDNHIVFSAPNGNNQRLYVGAMNKTYNLSYGSTMWGRTTNAKIKINEWQFLTVTVKDNVCSLYCDGFFVESLSETKSFTFAGNITIGRGDFSCNRQVRGVRVYDTCLSPREIREINKGLTVHFPLNQMDRQRNLIWDTNKGKTRWGYAFFDGEKTVEEYVEDGVRCVKFTCITPSSGWQYTQHTINNSILKEIKTNTSYTAYFKIKTNVNCSVYCNIMNGDALNQMSAYSNTVSIKGNEAWQEVRLTFLTKNSFDDITIGNQVLYFLGFNKVGYYIIKDLKLVEGSKTDSIWMPAYEDTDSWFDPTEYDTSGYSNNGSVSSIAPPTKKIR